jgi:hypothetical protein
MAAMRAVNPDAIANARDKSGCGVLVVTGAICCDVTVGVAGTVACDGFLGIVEWEL